MRPRLCLMIYFFCTFSSFFYLQENLFFRLVFWTLHFRDTSYSYVSGLCLFSHSGDFFLPPFLFTMIISSLFSMVVIPFSALSTVLCCFYLIVLKFFCIGFYFLFPLTAISLFAFCLFVLFYFVL